MTINKKAERKKHTSIVLLNQLKPCGPGTRFASSYRGGNLQPRTPAHVTSTAAAHFSQHLELVMKLYYHRLLAQDRISPSTTDIAPETPARMLINSIRGIVKVVVSQYLNVIHVSFPVHPYIFIYRISSIRRCCLSPQVGEATIQGRLLYKLN